LIWFRGKGRKEDQRKKGHGSGGKRYQVILPGEGTEEKKYLQEGKGICKEISFWGRGEGKGGGKKGKGCWAKHKGGCQMGKGKGNMDESRFVEIHKIAPKGKGGEKQEEADYATKSGGKEENGGESSG